MLPAGAALGAELRRLRGNADPHVYQQRLLPEPGQPGPAGVHQPGGEGHRGVRAGREDRGAGHHHELSFQSLLDAVCNGSLSFRTSPSVPPICLLFACCFVTVRVRTDQGVAVRGAAAVNQGCKPGQAKGHADEVGGRGVWSEQMALVSISHLHSIMLIVFYMSIVMLHLQD